VREGGTKCRHPVVITIKLHFNTRDILEKSLCNYLLIKSPPHSPSSRVYSPSSEEATRQPFLGYRMSCTSSSIAHKPFFFSADDRASPGTTALAAPPPKPALRWQPALAHAESHRQGVSSSPPPAHTSSSRSTPFLVPVQA